jgi:hypothetical protein
MHNGSIYSINTIASLNRVPASKAKLWSRSRKKKVFFGEGFQIRQGLMGSNMLGGTFVRGSSVANNLFTNCTTQHPAVRMTEILTFSGNMMDLLMIRTLGFLEPWQFGRQVATDFVALKEVVEVTYRIWIAFSMSGRLRDESIAYPWQMWKYSGDANKWVRVCAVGWKPNMQMVSCAATTHR